MTKIRIITFAFIFVCGFFWAQINSAAIPEKLEIPLCAGTHAEETGTKADDHERRDFFAFSVCYREHYEQAEWAAYEFTWKYIENPAKRNENFRADPKISTGSAALEDYKYSGFDRGHLVPAGDMVFDERAMSESFFLSNMSPQIAGFNRGVWLRLENQTRAWAKKFGTVWIVTGPVLEKKQYETIGKNAVAIPEYFYKIILTFANNSWQAIGFIMPNKSSPEHIFTFAVPIREIEARTGINFFYKLPQDVQDSIETNIKLSLWQ